MKKYLIRVCVLLVLFTNNISAQYTPSNDERIDVKFYHIDIEVGIDTSSIEGNVEIMFISEVDDLSDIILDMSPNLILDSISNNLDFSRTENHVNIFLDNIVYVNESYSLKIYYHSTVLNASFKGVRYETHQDGVPVIATLSTPYLGHIWYPCKDGTTDKADSVFVDITIENRIYDEVPLKAVSNGLLSQVVNINDTHTKYMYQHRYPIVPYYVMFAISNYIDVEQNFYSSNGDEFPIRLYTFPENLNKANDLLIYLADNLIYIESILGPYPFSKELLGFTELGFYGGIEDQTNIVINNYNTNFYEVAIHEVAHMWFACSQTCKTWNEGWLNEGFATYVRALNQGNIWGQGGLDVVMSNQEFYQGGTIYLDDINDPFSVFTSIIYKKGAWTLHMLRALLGDEDFFDVLYAYSQDPNLQYGNVTLNDFKMHCESEYGGELDWFFNQWINEEHYPDLDYNFVIQDNSIDISLVQKQINFGYIAFDMPLEIKFTFENGNTEIGNVWIDSYEHNYSFQFDENISTIELDPRNVLLDKHFLNVNLPVSNTTLNQDEIIVFPNPATENIFLETDKTIEYVLLLDLNGKETTLFGDKVYSLKNIIPGFYTLVFKVDGELFRKKMIIN